MYQLALYQLATIAVIMLALDAAWLTYIAPTFRQMIAQIQSMPMTIRVGPAVVVYVLMILGLWWFVVRPATSWYAATAQGAALGAVVYGVYDFTNYSTITGYTHTVAISDTLWGTFLFAVTAGLTKVIV